MATQLSLFQDEWPKGLTYLENYLSEDEAGRLVQEVDTRPWRTDLKRRVQHYGYHYDYKARQARREDHLGSLPELFQQLAERLTTEGVISTPYRTKSLSTNISPDRASLPISTANPALERQSPL